MLILNLCLSSNTLVFLTLNRCFLKLLFLHHPLPYAAVSLPVPCLIHKSKSCLSCTVSLVSFLLVTSRQDPYTHVLVCRGDIHTKAHTPFCIVHEKCKKYNAWTKMESMQLCFSGFRCCSNLQLHFDCQSTQHTRPRQSKAFAQFQATLELENVSCTLCSHYFA